MNQIIKNLEAIEQELEATRNELSERLSAVHQEFRPRLEAICTRRASYRLVAEELGLLTKQDESDEPPPAQEETEEPIQQEAEKPKQDEVTAPRHPAQKYDMPLGDAAEKILRESGNKQMRLSDLYEKVLQLGINPRPSAVSFRSALPKDAKKRFIQVRRGVYKLREAEEEKVEEENSETQQVTDSLPFPPISSNGKTPQNKEFVLTDAIREIASELNDEQFDADWLFDTLKEKYPSDISEERRNSVVATLGYLATQGFLSKIQRGKDGKPAIFKPVVQENPVSDKTLEEAVEEFEKDDDDDQW